jgi:hypothetical protein
MTVSWFLIMVAGQACQFELRAVEPLTYIGALASLPANMSAQKTAATAVRTAERRNTTIFPKSPAITSHNIITQSA